MFWGGFSKNILRRISAKTFPVATMLLFYLQLSLNILLALKPAY